MASHDLMPDEISHGYVVFLGVTGTMTFLSTVSVVLRFTSRVLTLSVKWDDWACLGALVFAYGFMVTTALVATVGRAGYHIEEYSIQTLEKYSQIALANNVIYNVSITLSKVSMLLFYRRIFTIRKGFRLVCWLTGFFVFGYFISAVCGLIFAASPVEAQWKIWLPHTTIHSVDFWLAAGIINIILDFVILCLPQPLVWKLHLSQERKALLSSVFCLGGFVCIASIVRLVYLANLNMSDETYALVNPGVWTMIELNMSIICSCLATFPSLLRHFRNSPHRGTDTGYSNWPSHSQRPLNGDTSCYDHSTAYAKRSESGQSLDKAYYTADYMMNYVNSVRVQTDVRVTLDGNSQETV